MQNFQETSYFDQITTDDGLLLFVRILAREIDRQSYLPSDINDVIKHFIADLDQTISIQLNWIIHHEDFKTLESAWRSLHFLVKNTNSNHLLKIKVMHLTKKELLKDFERSFSFDQSYIFKKIHDDEYGVFAGQPFGVIIGNYEFDFSPQDMSVLENFAKVAETSYAPFIASVSPEAISKSLQNQQWQRFRRKPEAMFVSLCPRRILLRNRYASILWNEYEPDETTAVESFDFTEKINSHDDYLWGNPAFAFGVKLTESFDKHRWCAEIEGEYGGELAAKLPTIETFTNEKRQTSLDSYLTDSQLETLRDEGFNLITEHHCVVFLQALSCAKPFLSDSEPGNPAFKNFVALPETFAVSRFAHYLKTMILDNQYCRTPEDWHGLLNRWIRRYCETGGNRCSELKPLKSALINIQKDTSKSEESYAAVCFIKAGFQIPEIGLERRILIRNIPIHRPSRYGINSRIDKGTEDIQPSQPFQFKTGLPRQLVKITYDIEVGSFIEEKELPFVAGIIGDFVGNPMEPLPKLAVRKFIEINTGNFDEVIAAFSPRVSFAVKNTLLNDGSELNVELNFKHLEDFDPDNLVKQIKPLQQLIEERQNLFGLFYIFEGDENLENFLQHILDNPDELNQLIREINDLKR